MRPICLSMIGWLLICSAPVATAQNLLQNADFEDGSYTSTYGEVGNHWQPAGRPDLAGASYSLHYYETLGNFQRMQPSAVGWEAGICQRVTGLTPGELISFSGELYPKVPGCTAWVAIDRHNDLSDGQLPARIVQVPYTGNWERFETSATVGSEGEVAVYVWAYCQSTQSYINVDNMELVYSADHITNLTVADRLSDALNVTWQPADGATYYEIRYSTEPITEENWSSATVVPRQWTPAPDPSGYQSGAWFRDLAPGTQYYVAVKFGRSDGGVSALSNVVSASTTPAGTAPYWAWITKERLQEFYGEVLSGAQEADYNTGATANQPDNLLNWYYGGWDPDCENQVGIGSILTIVRNEWLLDFWGRLSDHVWELTFTNWPLDKNIYNQTGIRVAAWNESHHGGECSWNGVGLIFHDWDNPKWLQRAEEYAAMLHNWTGYTGNPPHLHFKSFWMRENDCDCAAVRNIYCQIDNPENRRFTRSLWYSSWRDPTIEMPDGQLISDFLYELDASQADDAMTEGVAGKPLGIIPAEVRFDTHQIAGYSGVWWQTLGGMGGTPGVNEWYYDWRVGWVQCRDSYWEQIDQWLTSGYPNSIATVRETIRYFSVDQAINNIPPAFMYEPPYPWPIANEPWGNYQYLINYLYRAATGDTQFDANFMAHAELSWNKLPAPGEPRYAKMDRASTNWLTGSDTFDLLGAKQPFMLAYLITRDKEWLARAMDEMKFVDVGAWLEAVYNGMPTLGLLRLPDQPMTWNNTDAFTDFASLVLEHDAMHLKWVSYNFDEVDRLMPIWLWTLDAGDYVVKHGPDLNGDDQMDYVAGGLPFTYQGRRTEVPITLPAGRLEVFEITPADCNSGPDSDGDGVRDDCDFCPGTFLGALVDDGGCPVAFKPDFDGDGDVDQSDFGFLQRCMTGPNVPVDTAECEKARLDSDDLDVDAEDLDLFVDCLSGSNIPFDPGCLPAE